MDESNLEDVLALAGRAAGARIQLLLEYGGSRTREVPDPYYGGENGFEQVLDLVETACRDFLDSLSGTQGNR
jgi:protein-tyrosine phosphatase